MISWSPTVRTYNIFNFIYPSNQKFLANLQFYQIKWYFIKIKKNRIINYHPNYITQLQKTNLNMIYGYIVALCGWAAKADESVLARNQTKDSWTWNLAVSGSGKGTRMRVDDATQQRAVGGWRAEKAVGGWRAERAVGGWTAEKRGSMG